MKAALLAALSLVMMSSSLAAHEEFRTVGTIAKRYADANKSEFMDVRTTDQQTVPIWINKNTVVKQNDKNVPVSELKVGRTVVIDSYGDSYAYSEALTVRIVPAIPPAK